MKRLSLFVCISLLLLLVAAGVPLVAATPTVTSVRPVSGPNNGDITLTITGTGFDGNSTVWLRKCVYPSATIDGTILSISKTQIKATFPLDGKYVGDYDVRVNTPTSFMGSPSDDIGILTAGFEVYKATGSSSSTTTATTTEETVATTATTVSSGENSVFFQTEPTGAEIWLDGEDVGTSTFTYYTNHEGTFDVVVKKIGYEDYPAKVTILEGKRVSFMAPLTPLSSSSTTTVTTKPSATPGKTTSSGKNTTAIPKSTMKVPTPWGTDPPVTEESPVDPALALGAAGIVIGFVLLRRR
jgi:hypothetical protein